MTLEAIMWYYILATLMGLGAVGLCGMVCRPHMIKKLLMLTIFSDAIELIAVLAGYRISATQPPVYPGGVIQGFVFPNPQEAANFANSAVDPLPQVLIVTAIVIGLAVLLFLATLASQAGRKFGTQNLNKIEKRGE